MEEFLKNPSAIDYHVVSYSINCVSRTITLLVMTVRFVPSPIYGRGLW